MNSVDYRFLDPDYRINKAPKLHQMLAVFGLLLSLSALIIRFYLHNQISHYQLLNAQILKQTAQLDLNHSKKTSLSIKQHQEKFLKLLQLVSHSLPPGTLLTQLQLAEDFLVIKGKARSRKAVKNYTEHLEGFLKLNNFSLEPDNEQNLEFALRFSCL